MRYLLDTHAFLWLASDDARLTARVRDLFVAADKECWLSAASVWEMAIKASLGKLSLGTTLEQLVRGGVDRGVRLLDVGCRHAYPVERLPFHHRDPFDRILIAQAIHEGLALVSADDRFDAYAVTRVWS